ncbi:hypothetical protein EDF42_1331 [Curtobacterium sp. PhB172]|uniref:hypothetical protein n=1 Tax=Curtobacterium sp. PhB172 TaxID=2485196 RepID=UPI000FB23AB4|nr:hypothetical protein [Curtobacterium sp. PhB172]ROS67304.1 hypothetical protein EDF42_1331 [Curtobacterium sp. PhB172]
MAHDDVAAERARLEAVAWGAASSPADAARARIALQDLASGRRSGGRRAGAGVVSATVSDERPGGTTPASGQVASSDRSAPLPGSSPEGSAPLPGWSPERPAQQSGSPEPSAPEHGRSPGPSAPGRAAAVAEPDPSPRTEAGSWAATEALEPDRPDDAGDDVGGEPGLPVGPTRRSRWRTLLWTERPRVWIALGAAAAVGVAFAAGTVVGPVRGDVAAAPSVTPTAGTVTLEQLLDVPQTYADQLPGPVEAPVSLHSTRLVFTNRALDGGSFDTPWAVWAGVGTDRSTICLVATANRIESSTACFPREAALHGSVSMSAQSMSGTLTIALRGGGVQGRVTNEN